MEIDTRDSTSTACLKAMESTTGATVVRIEEISNKVSDRAMGYGRLEEIDLSATRVSIQPIRSAAMGFTHGTMDGHIEAISTTILEKA
jgi:hypothetical protein